MEAQTVMACTACGSPEKGRFCGMCGAPVAQAEPVEHWQQRFTRAPRETKSLKLANEAAREVRQLLPLFLEPLQNLRAMPAAVWRTALIVAGVGILPLVIGSLSGDEVAQYWAIALYFSVLWAVFFYYVFRPRAFRPIIAFAVFFFTGVVSMPLLFAVLGLGLEALRDPFIAVHFAPVTIPAAAVFIGVPEELTKALAVVLLARFFGVGVLRTFLVYGLISGLGFGIYEGISYQTHANVAAFNATDDLGGYYLANMMRLTATPFLHACWTGIAAYFIWFGTKFPARKLGLFALAIAVPAALHGVYDGVGMSGLPQLAWPIAAASALLLCVYMGRADGVEQRLAQIIGATAEQSAAP